jgi:hypothetical protein
MQCGTGGRIRELANSRKDKLQLIPLDLLLDPPPQYSRRGWVATARLLFRTIAGKCEHFERWHWCLAFGLSASLAGIILWLCSSNLHGLILFLVVPGLVYPLELLSENTRKYQAVGSLIVLYAALGITGLGYTFYTIYS